MLPSGEDGSWTGGGAGSGNSYSGCGVFTSMRPVRVHAASAAPPSSAALQASTTLQLKRPRARPFAGGVALTLLRAR